MATSRKPPPALKQYVAKRNFASTPEPGPTEPRQGRRSAGKLAFCVQKHLASHLHYDFRLEWKGVLLSWAVPKGPSLDPKDKRLAMRVEDHPFDYRNFEGVIPEGYGAGIVLLWDQGTWLPENDDVDAALEAGELKLQLFGVKLKGSWVLVRTGGPRDAGGESRSWLLIKHRDEWAGKGDVVNAAPQSVKSFGDFADILARDKPDIWTSHRPAQGGDAGAMFQEIIEQATKLKLKKSSSAATRAPAAKRKKPTATPRKKR